MDKLPTIKRLSDDGLTHMYLSTRKRLYYPTAPLDVDIRCNIAKQLGEIEREMEFRDLHNTHLAWQQNDEHRGYYYEAELMRQAAATQKDQRTDSEH